MKDGGRIEHGVTEGEKGRIEGGKGREGEGGVGGIEGGSDQRKEGGRE